MCRVLRLAPSGYYKWLHGHESSRAREDRRLMVELRTAHAESDRTYGTRRLRVELEARGLICGRGRLRRLMRQAGIEAVSRRKKRRWIARPQKKVTIPNLVARQFSVSRPNEVWVADTTEFKTGEGTIYLAAVLDLYARRVVGWAVSPSMHRTLAITALDLATRSRGDVRGVIHHADQGSQYTSDDYLALLERHGMQASFSGRGQCLDNAPMESFFSTLKAELVSRRYFDTHADAEQALFQYIEVFYNRRRRHSVLSYRTPVEHESLYVAAPEAA